MNSYSFYDCYTQNESEQSLYQDLADEQINLYGAVIYYLPRESIFDKAIDDITYSKFEHAIQIRALLQNTEGFGTEPEFLTKFDLYIKDEVRFVISTKQWTDVIHAYDVTLTGEAEQFIEPQGKHQRPIEGDLVYFPLTDDLYEIKYVQQETPFYQFGKIQFYTLQAQIYVDTGNEKIDIQNHNIDTLFDADKDNKNDIIEINEFEDRIGSKVTLKLEKINDLDEPEDFEEGEVITIIREEYLGEHKNYIIAKATVSNWAPEITKLTVINATRIFQKGEEITTEEGNFTNWRVAEEPTDLNAKNNIYNSNSELQEITNDFIDWDEPNPIGESYDKTI